ncbi:hypothetical protein SLNSH_23085 [Alsobacter soli]|uniref:Uncharacterized protein n=1 Tax=Alsobacter soli TaxID=2109933 RepID=A0A2T1HLT9_9HYPH|nr:hypothetical protein [Alsobacter soli]PSC02620.1 hypothetical protein SLNSH_23085 [Alsobacter soli]
MSARVPDDQGPDTPINMAATTADEELPFAGSTPDAPSIAEPGAPQDFDALTEQMALPAWTPARRAGP